MSSEERGPSVANRAVSIREVGPRDGLQNESPITTAAKLRVIEALVVGGAQRIEATSFVSPAAVPALADAAEVAIALARWPEVEWSALVANVRGVERAIDCGLTRLEYVLSASDAHSQANVRRTTAEAVALIPELARLVHRAGGTLEVVVATAWDCPFEGAIPGWRVRDLVIQAIDFGADAICLADTIGTVTPARLLDLLGRIRKQAPGFDLALHLHNTRGMGMASAYAGLMAGVTSFDSSIGGLGGCPFAPGATGNIATEELVYLCRELGLATGYELDQVLSAAQKVQGTLGFALPSSMWRAGDRPHPQQTG